MESDLDLAFRLQMEEAIAASLSILPSSSSTAASSSRLQPPANSDRVYKFDELEAVVRDKIEQERRDREMSESEARRMRLDLSRRILDQKFAQGLIEIPDEDWEEFGNDITMSLDEGSSTGTLPNYETYRLYFKGLLSEEVVGGKKVTFCGIGIAICDPRDNLIFELKKPVRGVVSRQTAEFKALLEGLEIAFSLGLKRIIIFCDYYPVYQYVTRRWHPKRRNIARLMSKVEALQSKFALCHPNLVSRNKIKYAFKLAREALASEMAKPADSNIVNSLKVTCPICLEETNMDQMFPVAVCSHTYCFSCMKQHMEVKLLHGEIPKCPHEKCKSELKIDCCEKFLTPKLVEIMKQRLKEASIPPAEKVYCPFPRCSELMSVIQASEFARKEAVIFRNFGQRKCVSCARLFCINCKVPWHQNMACREYKRLYPSPPEDMKLKSLALTNLWRQCVKCNHMIELAEGCYHMTCRCGHEFCYTCGAEWKTVGGEFKATCSCPLFDDDYDSEDDDFDSEDEEDDDVEYY
ncbi:hypothetical protein V2J09_000055 [Rumex salicifolius]